MRTLVFAVVCLGVALSLAGCVPSLHGVATPSNTVVEKGLIGTWADRDSPGEVWDFRAASTGKSYDLIYTSDGEPVEVQAYLVKIGNNLLLDLYPKDEAEPKNVLKAMLKMPVHDFARVELSDDSLSIRMLNPDWLERMVKTGETSIAHDSIQGTLILTARTPELLAFFRKYGMDDNAFLKPGAVLQRVKK